MNRTSVNPWPWSLHLGYAQGEVVSGEMRTLYAAGQTATDATGAPQHAGDMGAQIALALDNLEAVLAGADMTLANLVRLTIYTTDADRLFQHYGGLMARLGAARATPPTTLLEVKRLAVPDLLVEFEGTAVA